MKLTLEVINLEKYPLVKNDLFELVKKIWPKKESYDNAIHSIERWFKNKESGLYYFILLNGKRVGITGYWSIKNDKNTFGLRHHGTALKGIGKEALKILIEEINRKEGGFCRLIELIPKGKEELISIFEKWGFKLDPKGVPEWEPKKDYYKYAMIMEN